MKPLHVRMQAFGPYAGEHTLDFADLGDNRFFLITGPTGSGKTSVLDAMAFALYGETTSGSEKEGGRLGADMRSQHAPPGLLTEVEFAFAVGAERYRVLRQPAQDRPRKRGEGMAQELQQATLWRLAADGGGRHGADHEAPLATGWSAVTREAEAILGFRAEQFRQVVMLPQGRFQELLRSDSRGREEILATLFDTTFYARIEAGLKDKAADLDRRHRLLDERRGLVLEQAGVTDAADLEAEQERAAAAATDAAQAAALAADDLVAAQQALTDAQAVLAKLDTLACEADAVAALEGRAAQVDEQRCGLQAARRAALVADAADAARLRDAEHATQELRLLEAAQALELARGELAQAEAAWTAEQTRQDERDAAVDAARRLRDLEPVVAGLAALRAELDDASAATGSLVARRDEAARAADGAQQRAERARAALASAEQAAAALPGHEQLAAQARRRAEQRSELEELGAAYGEAQEAAATASSGAGRAEAAYGDAVAQLAVLEESWARGQAGVLAAALEPGQPCPVCGSTEHPLPASAADVPSEAEVQAARAVRDDSLATRDKAARVAVEAEHAADELAQQIERLVKTLGAAGSLQELEAAATTAEGELQAARQAVAATPALRDERAAAETAAHEAAERREELSRRQGEAAAAEQALKATLAERLADVPQECADPAALEAALDAAERRRAELEEAAAAAQRRVQAALVLRSGAETDVKAAEHAVAVAAQAALKARELFAARLAEHGFDDETAWQEACCPAEEADALEESVRRFDADLVAARARRDQAADAAAGLSPPDVEAARTLAEEARGRAEEAAAAKARLDARSAALDAAAEQLALIGASSAELERDYAVLGRVAEVVNGRNPLRLNFQRFVLGAFLDRVLEVASRRLRLMSADRYELQRTEASRGHGRAAGLELVVFDAWTGYARPVSTLSGGETFLAALALALGLAEVVQSYSGGIRLDTIFVDEGFGALDDEALDLAVDTLMALQDGGRLVGIISHVAELRERIFARLEVTASKTGSTARFVVP